MDKETIKSILLAHGFTIKQGEADLKPYVYSAADAIYEAGWMKGAEKGGRDALRERIAAKCLQGLLAGQYGGETWDGTLCLPPIDQLAEYAAEIADALIAKLDKDQ